MLVILLKLLSQGEETCEFNAEWPTDKIFLCLDGTLFIISIGD